MNLQTALKISKGPSMHNIFRQIVQLANNTYKKRILITITRLITTFLTTYYVVFVIVHGYSTAYTTFTTSVYVKAYFQISGLI